MGYGYIFNAIKPEKAKSRPVDAPFQEAAQKAYQLLDKYYIVTNNLPGYVLSLVVDLRMKLSILRASLAEEWTCSFNKLSI